MAKGLGMLFVQMGHTYFPQMIIQWIYSFHMPLFFILSGMTFSVKEYKTKTYIVKKVKSLLLPYYFFAIINYFLAFVLDKITHTATTDVFSYFKPYFIPYRERPMWFLMALFISEIVFFIIQKYCIKGEERRQKWLFAILFFFSSIWYLFDIVLPFYLDIMPAILLFLQIGFMGKETEHKKHIYAFVAIVGNILCAILNYKAAGSRVEMVVNEYGIFVIFVVGAVLGVYAVIHICKILEGTKWSKIISYIGKNSIVFYGFHISINGYVDRILSRVVPYYRYNQVMDILCGVLLLIFTFSILSVMAKLYNCTLKKWINKYI